jgi:hypothetical protein
MSTARIAGGPSLGRIVPAFGFCRQNDTFVSVIGDEVNSRVPSLHEQGDAEPTAWVPAT